jgi:hypothetical protein
MSSRKTLGGGQTMSSRKTLGGLSSLTYSLKRTARTLIVHCCESEVTLFNIEFYIL